MNLIAMNPTSEDLTLSGQVSLNELESILANDFPKAECPLEHTFAPGLYRRTVTSPPGTMGTSLRHRHTHFFFLSRGIIRIMSETEGWITYTAPCMGVTLAGTKRLIYTPDLPENAEGSVWTTIHSNPGDETDVEKVVSQLVDPNENPLLLAGQGEDWRGSPELDQTLNLTQ